MGRLRASVQEEQEPQGRAAVQCTESPGSGQETRRRAASGAGLQAPEGCGDACAGRAFCSVRSVWAPLAIPRSLCPPQGSLSTQESSGCRDGPYSCPLTGSLQVSATGLQGPGPGLGLPVELPRHPNPEPRDAHTPLTEHSQEETAFHREESEAQRG